MFLRHKISYLSIGAIAIVFLAGILFFGYEKNDVPVVKAAAADNFFRGFAWSSNIGWISFNSKNCDIDGDGTYEGAGETGGSAPAECPIAGAVIPYSVNIDIGSAASTGELSGYAWSPNIGWISFDKTITGLPPGAPFNNDLQNYIAAMDGSNNLIGWARAINACRDTLWIGVKCTGSGAGNRAGGWDGWIKLSSATYETILVGSDLEGFAWGSSVVGWISFNSKNCNPAGTGSSGLGGCPLPVGASIPDYKVYLSGNPYAENFTGSKPDYCNKPAILSLQWIYRNVSGADQDQYHLQVATDPGFTNIAIDVINPQVVVKNDPGSYALRIVPVVIDLSRDILYGTTYYLRLQVHAAGGDWSNWINYDDPLDSDGDGFPNTFTTSLHEYPDVGFAPPVGTATSANIPIGVPVNFSITGNAPDDNTKCYPVGATDIENCAKWEWDFNYNGTTFVSDREINGNNGDTTNTYTTSGDYEVMLKVTDADDVNHYCFNMGGTQTITTAPANWKEVIPINQ